MPAKNPQLAPQLHKVVPGAYRRHGRLLQAILLFINRYLLIQQNFIQESRHVHSRGAGQSR